MHSSFLIMRGEMLLTLKMNYFSRVFPAEQESPIHRKLYGQMKLLVR